MTGVPLLAAAFLLGVIVGAMVERKVYRRLWVIREAERRFAAAEKRLRDGVTSPAEFRRGSNPPPNAVKPPPPAPPPMRVIREGYGPRKPEDVQ